MDEETRVTDTVSITDLPEEVLLFVFHFLPFRSLCALCCTCKLVCVVLRHSPPPRNWFSRRYDAWQFNALAEDHYLLAEDLQEGSHLTSKWSYFFRSANVKALKGTKE